LVWFGRASPSTEPIPRLPSFFVLSGMKFHPAAELFPITDSSPGQKLKHDLMAMKISNQRWQLQFRFRG
jgi:hypothetical protein